MCQILGINTAEPTSFAMSFRKFCDRGGCADVHKDGWGMCLYQGRGIRSFYDTTACCHSATARFVQDAFSAHHQRTSNLLAHIRYATHGDVRLENLHPFVRELWGISWCFAHNGDLPLFAHISKGHHVLLGQSTADNLSFHAIGETDSEAVFCAILNALKAEFRELPTLSELHEFLLQLCDEIVGKGDIFNFILLCGPYTLFAYSWPGQRPASDTWNGLYYLVRQTLSSPISASVELEDEDYSVKIPASTEMNNSAAAGPEKDPQPQRVAIIATKPLTDEAGWIEMKPRELLMFDRGVPHSKSTELDAIEQEGRGLSSKCFPKAACPVCRGTPITNSKQDIIQHVRK